MSAVSSTIELHPQRGAILARTTVRWRNACPRAALHRDDQFAPNFTSRPVNSPTSLDFVPSGGRLL